MIETNLHLESRISRAVASPWYNLTRILYFFLDDVANSSSRAISTLNTLQVT